MQADDVIKQLDSLRVQILDRVLPVPKNPVRPSEIRLFKDRHSTAIADFRRRVEREVVQAASIQHPELRRRQLEIFVDEAEEQIQEIQSWMHSAGWRVARGGLSVIAAIPGATWMFGLLGAVWEAITGGNRPLPSRDFAYAAYVEEELG